jgi:transcriptional regulator with XRE-family HTH domain
MLARMDDARIGRTVRILRQRRGWRQRDLGLHAGISKAAISDIERGRVDRYTLATIRRVLRSLSATVELYATWGGAGDLDRLLDADHALVVELWAGRHQAAGWELLPEASYSIFGERGRIDLLAFHPTTGVLEVAECKTGIWDVQDTIGRLDAKVRLARRVAAERGWRVSRVVPALVIAEGRTARRRIAQHSSLFGRFECRGHSALRSSATRRGPPVRSCSSSPCQNPTREVLGELVSVACGRARSALARIRRKCCHRPPWVDVDGDGRCRRRLRQA